ncbi:PP2C family protein-serine/threonine phosphatase [Leifsonia sp. LS-T14]|uniref:PP2C family protein-serine/threonine phosphatase n=1 Tax=unclassified Leifsonia TaxID=2663824 RepID=UPI0035A6CDA2
MVVDGDTQSTSALAAEVARQDAVEALGILDTVAEDRFDRVTRMAQQLFDVPMVSVTLIDGDRQWRKSHVGLGDEAPREGAFCDFTVRQDAALIVRDASTDERFRSNPFVVGDPHLRFYAGEPLHAPGGEAVGTLCVLDTEPHELTDGQRRLLRDLADWVQAELTREEDLDRAQLVQRALLPRRKPAAKGFAIAAASEPGDRISGDFYDWYDCGDGFCLTVGDVVGTGLPVAIVAASVRAALRVASAFTGPEAAVAEGARVVDEELQLVAAYTSVFHARVEPDGRMEFVDAGHGLAFVLRGASGDLERLETATLPLGLDRERRTARQLILEDGDQFLCLSDGVFDALGGEKGLLRVQSILRGSVTPAGAVSRIVSAARQAGANDGDALAIVLRRDAVAY